MNNTTNAGPSVGGGKTPPSVSGCGPARSRQPQKRGGKAKPTVTDATFLKTNRVAAMVSRSNGGVVRKSALSAPSVQPDLQPRQQLTTAASGTPAMSTPGSSVPFCSPPLPLAILMSAADLPTVIEPGLGGDKRCPGLALLLEAGKRDAPVFRKARAVDRPLGLWSPDGRGVLPWSPVYAGEELLGSLCAHMTEVSRRMFLNTWEQRKDSHNLMSLLSCARLMRQLAFYGRKSYFYGSEAVPGLPSATLIVSEADVVITRGHFLASGFDKPIIRGTEYRIGTPVALRANDLDEGDIVVSRIDAGGEDMRNWVVESTGGVFWSRRLRISFVCDANIGGERWQFAKVVKSTCRVLPCLFGHGPREVLSRRTVREALREIPHGDPAVRARIAWGLVQAYQSDRIVSSMQRAMVTEPTTLERMDAVDFVDAVQEAERAASETWGIPSMTVQW